MSRSDKKPNILFILTDQQSATMMSCAGNPWLSTPAMDSLAATGTRFERGYCTNPVCLPSRFSLMTGLMPGAADIWSNNTSHVESVAESIRRNTLGFLLSGGGYEVAYGGKIHLPNSMHPSELGFDYLTEDKRDGLASCCAEYVGRRHEQPWFLYCSLINPHDICFMALRDDAQNCADSRRFATPGPGETKRRELVELDRALERPAGVSEEEFFERNCPPLPPNFDPQEDEPAALEMLRRQRHFKQNAFETWSEERWREHRWAYARLTERVDGQIGVILDALRKSGQEEDTVVIFTSDHGDLDGAHRMEHKTALYEEALRVPFIVSQPGTTPAGAVDETHLVSNGLDLLPTLCDYAGLAPPAGYPGQSVRPLAEGAEPCEWRSGLYLESEIGRGLHEGDAKYALYNEGANREQLYDLAGDPHETRNAASDGARAERLSSMRESFRELRTHMDRFQTC
jgi:arylsulfatase A-like enzyme